MEILKRSFDTGYLTRDFIIRPARKAFRDRRRVVRRSATSLGRECT
jgi:hypothetical protein